MKKIFAMLIVFFVVSLAMAGCGVITIDGQVDAQEQTLLDLSAGATLTEKPELVAPAYSVSEKLLAFLAADTESVSVSALDTKAAEYADALGLTTLERAQATEVYNAVKTTLIAKLNALSESLPEDKTYLMKAVVQAVYSAAQARLE
jgi:hypothetical protein